MRPPAASVLVLGLGNDILTDDAVGLRVADAARDRLAGEPEIEVKSTTEMGLSLLDEMAGREGLVLVDSIRAGGEPPGHIHEFPAAGGAPAGSRAFRSPHFLGVADALALGRLLGLDMPSEISVFAIEVADPFTLGMELTPAVARAVAPAADLVAARARELARRTPFSVRNSVGVDKGGLAPGAR